MKIKIIIFLLVAIGLGLGAYYFISQKYATDTPVVINTAPNIKEPEAPKKNENNFPDSLLLKVPFTPQAPTANWDELHNEACEEASIIMASQYFAGNTETNLNSNLVEQEISKLTQWQKDNFGYYLDTTVKETAQMVEQVYGLKTELIENFSEADIKEALNKNYLVVISFNGRLLGNPNFKQPGPIHHMLVIKGYNKTGIVTNDPGTRRGLNYNYTFQTLYNAAADWDHSKENVDTSKKVAIIIKPK